MRNQWISLDETDETCHLWDDSSLRLARSLGVGHREVVLPMNQDVRIKNENRVDWLDIKKIGDISLHCHFGDIIEGILG